MTDTTPSNTTHDADHDARKGSRPKEPDDAQVIPSDQPGIADEETPPTSLEAHSETTGEIQADETREQASQREPESEGVPRRASDLPTSQDEARAGESTGFLGDVPPKQEKSGPHMKPSGEQFDMQIDTPTGLETQLPDSSVEAQGFQSPFSPFVGSESHKIDLDLLSHIPGLFRLLDLYLERGSDDNFEKVIIDHDSMGDAMNAIRDGSYKTISKIDFAALDTISIKPVGVYGSKSAIIQFLLDAGVIDESMAESLRKPLTQHGQLAPYLRSGIYLLVNTFSSNLEPSSTVIHVIYWPEDETWNDNASQTVQKNRVTFMRYLTKLASDIQLLVSKEHAASFVWKCDGNGDTRDAEDESSSDEDSDSDDRFVKFEVTKTVDEEEGVQTFPGFVFQHPALDTTGCSNTTLKLIPSETSLAFVVTTIREAGFHREDIRSDFTALRLIGLMKEHRNIHLGEKIDEASIHSLFEQGALPPSAGGIYLEYLKLDMTAPEFQDKKSAAISELQSNSPVLKKQVEQLVRQRFGKDYPTLDLGSSVGSDSSPEDYLTSLLEMAPKARNVYERYQMQSVPSTIESAEYQAIRERFLDVQEVLETTESITDEERRLHIKGIYSPDSSKEPSLSKHSKRSPSSRLAKFANAAWAYLSPSEGSNKSHQKFSRSSLGRNDVEFLATIDSYSVFPDYAPAIRAIQIAAKTWIEDRIAETTDDLARTLLNTIEVSILENVACTYKWAKFAQCRADICKALLPDPSPPMFLSLQSLERNPRSRQPKFAVEALVYTRGSASVEYSMTQLEVRPEDAHALDDDPLHLPSLAHNHSPITRSTPTDYRLLYIQLLDMGRKLLQVFESPGGIDVFLDDAGDTTIRNRQRRFASREDRPLFFAADEETSLFAIASVDQGRSSIYTFTMKDKFTTLQQRGAPHELTPGYGEIPPEIKAICFFSGTEDICLLEESGRIRVYSLQTQAFRPGTVHLSSKPIMMRSSPDGSALVVVERTQDKHNWQARIFHQATFGENSDGITIRLPPEFDDATEFTVSSLGRRSHAYLVAHSPSARSLLSVALRISRIEAQYLFKEKKVRPARIQCVTTVHNSLVDCFSEVWDRFPVIPAIPREFTARRPPMQLTVIEYTAQSILQRFPRYFSDMIRDFTHRSPKPVGQYLDSIIVDVKSSSEDRVLGSHADHCQAGEWFVEVICLIPVHIALAQENRFVPLKDGRCRKGRNNELLGLEVSEIIDAITLGPYEAILGSYMATKPVRVVSSMGEQSVGKSFSLNHLADTSFAGSAMRTTQGVWLSLCPTEEQLVIALDFEGVHSLERTAQEDMLLVLFNAAISNLVMFRNNFALNRNVANMFTSFQASTHLFDPQNNPKLFKGLLAIIIKDVMDSDKREIVEEFRSKFNQIVLRERAENFITVLHDSQLAVMPWDVIQSKEFYARFSKLGKHLFKQRATHGNAGEFLLTLKTLMAKLTAQDWGAIDQTLIKHRTSIIRAALEQALISGRGEVGPFGESERLKNYDTQEEILTHDSGEIFGLAASDDARHESLKRLLAPLGVEPARSSAGDLCRHLHNIGEQRLLHVKTWIDSNLARFMPTDNPDITALQRRFDELSRTLVANLQLCLVKCDTCRLSCLHPRAHSTGIHDCGTSHRCIEVCDFCDPVDQARPSEIKRKNPCGLLAGHDGQHICEEAAHVCGKPCHMTSKQGCQKTCIKPIGHHHDVHVCAANLHQCGQPCKLQDIILHNGESFSCSNTCVLPFDQPHDSHTCSDERSCPVRCELCRRYCTLGDHFHGLEPGAIHLCEQDHPCREICQFPGTCMIEPKPESIEMVYRGLHDTFNYTRFTQIARRLNCGIPIPQGQRQHDGQHVHTTEESVVHFCEATCSHCGYICNLPYGHAQQKHETAHGSMQHTVWATEGPEESPFEVGGHRFGAQDRGAPQLCSMNCKHLGRHAHLEFCRNPLGICQEADTEHVHERIQPEPDAPKDWVSHKLFWTRTGFKDPYSQADQVEFALCDLLCSGREHEASEGQPAKPSYCVLPIFHPPQLQWGELDSARHVSMDGHEFHCPDPETSNPLFHVIFVLDCSTSMRNVDRLPLPDQSVTPRIVSRHNNRFGAVVSALYQFLEERNSSNGGTERRDSYSILVFNQLTEIIVENDTISSIDQLVDTALRASPQWGTNFSDALQSAQRVMEASWTAERAPVVVFLSDGEGHLDQDIMRGMCDRAVALGSPLSFWSISFGPYSRVLREMADIAKDVAGRAPRGSNAAAVPSAFCTAINTVQLAKTFSNIATSLRKARASLINPTAPLDHSTAPKGMLLM